MKNYITLAAILLTTLSHSALAFTEVACSSRSHLARAGSAPTTANAEEINQRVQALESSGHRVTVGQPSISVSTSAVNANLAVSIICVTLTYEK